MDETVDEVDKQDSDKSYNHIFCLLYEESRLKEMAERREEGAHSMAHKQVSRQTKMESVHMKAEGGLCCRRTAEDGSRAGR